MILVIGFAAIGIWVAWPISRGDFSSPRCVLRDRRGFARFTAFCPS
jgi:hypothetical protein